MTTFNKQELLAKFNLVKSAIARQSTISSLKMINIKVNKSKFKLTGGNGEYQISASGECFGDTAFNISVDPKTLAVMLGSAKEDIDMNVTDGKLITSSGRSKFNIPYIEGHVFPVINIDGDINGINLKDLINGVNKASPKVDVRNMLLGTCIDVRDGNINAVATDGVVLMINSMTCDIDPFSVIIPGDASEYLASNDTDGFVVNGNSLKAVSNKNSLEIITKLIDGKFPDWRRVVADYDNTFTANLADLIESVATINKIENVTSVNLRSSGNTLIISTKDCNGGTVINEIDFEGDDIDVSYNPALLLKCLQSMDSEMINISFNDIRWSQSSQDSKRFFVAPLRM